MSAPEEVIKGFPLPPPLDVGRRHLVTFKPGKDCPDMSSFLPRPQWEKLQKWWAEHTTRFEAWRASGDADENPLPCADDKLKNPLQIGPGAVEAINLAQTSGTSPPSLHDQLPLKVSVVDNVYAGTPIERLELSWERLTKILTTPQQLRKSKQDCRLFKLVTFGDSPNAKGSLRHNENVIELYGLVGDYDAELVTVEQASARLNAAGVEAFIYTTASHQPDKPRWRVIAPLSKPHTPGAHAALMDKLNGALEGILANESWTLSQVFYLGRVSGVVYETRHTRGQFLDLVTISPIGKGNKNAVMKAVADGDEATSAIEHTALLNTVNEETIADLRSALASMKSDDRDLWVKMAHALFCLRSDGHELWIDWSRSSDKFDDKDAERVWNSCAQARSDFRAVFAEAARQGWQNPRNGDASNENTTAATRIDKTDAGNVALLASITNGNLRFVPERITWLWWDGNRWEPDRNGTKTQSAALQVAEHYRNEAKKLRAQLNSLPLVGKERKGIDQTALGFDNWATACRNKRFIDNMLNLAKKDERFSLAVDQLDRDPWLFGVENGVVDLRTGILRQAAREDLVTKRSPVSFKPNAEAPRFLKFIEEITATPRDGRMVARPALARYLQQALGYSMCGVTREHKMFIVIGAGSNGKNVLLDNIQWLMGDYCQTIPPESLMATRNDADSERPSPTAATLAGARAAISSESKDGQRLDVALVKRHTGGGYMTARYLRENTFRFEITHKLWLMTNHRPALDHLDEALRGRLHLIPFDMCWNRPGHPESNPNRPDGDKDLPEKLKGEAEGILAWLVAGAVDYFKMGLKPPDEVVQMTRQFFKDQDPIGRWIETCTKRDPREGQLASELFDAYSEWCIEENGVESGPSNPTAFSNALKAHGIERHKKNTGTYYGLLAGRYPNAEHLVAGVG